MSQPRNRVRIIGGAWRRRLLDFPDATGLRPTPDAVRETLFNWLGQTLDGLVCLDLFAGSGALGFEAASRGARQVVMVEQNRQVLDALRTSVSNLRADTVVLQQRDGLKFLMQNSQRFDVVFVDPPYGAGLQATVLAALPPHLNPDARVYVEHDGSLQLPVGWAVWRESRAGKAHFCLLRRAALNHDSASPDSLEQDSHA